MTVSLILASIGVVVTIINFYLSFIRYPLHRLRYKSLPFRWISGFPLVGSLLLWIASLSFWLSGNGRYATVALILSIFDTGGIHWYIAGQTYERYRVTSPRASANKDSDHSFTSKEDRH